MTDMRTERGPAAEAYHPKADTQGVTPEADRCPRGGDPIPAHPVTRWLHGETACRV